MSEYKNYLAHHGVKGQRWGVRRYQNKDGTLTEEGRKRWIADSKQAQYVDAQIVENRKALQEVLKSDKLESSNKYVSEAIRDARKAGNTDDQIRAAFAMVVATSAAVAEARSQSIKYEAHMQKFISENANVTLKDVVNYGNQVKINELGISDNPNKRHTKKYEKERWRRVTR